MWRSNCGVVAGVEIGLGSAVLFLPTSRPLVCASGCLLLQNSCTKHSVTLHLIILSTIADQYRCQTDPFNKGPFRTTHCSSSPRAQRSPPSDSLTFCTSRKYSADLEAEISAMVVDLAHQTGTLWVSSHTPRQTLPSAATSLAPPKGQSLSFYHLGRPLFQYQEQGQIQCEHGRPQPE